MDLDFRQGDIFWLPLCGEGEGGIIHPQVIVQDDLLNASRVQSLVVCGLSTNMKKAYEPGNVLLEIGEGGLGKRSIVVVSQVSTAWKKEAGAYIGHLSPGRIEEILAGMAQVQALMPRPTESPDPEELR